MMKRIIALLLALILTVGLLPTVALATEGETLTTDSGSVKKEASKDNLKLVKTVTKEGDNYKVTLESWATGTVTSSSTPVPMDIILLLDQSGSMKKNFTSSSTETYNNLNKKNKKIYADYRNNCYIKSGNQYLKVTVTCQWEFGFSNDVYTYTWNGGSHTSTGGNSKPKIPLFYKSTTNSSTTRIAALKTAVSSFINKVNTEATTKNVKHRVAVVGFASTMGRNGQYENTELLSTADVVNYASANASASGIDYKNALVSATDKTRLSKAVDQLDANGDTYPEYGFDMANKIFAQYPIQDGDNRQRVVIMFTDGYPAPANTDNFNAGMANNAINNAKGCKDNNAKVYTIGIFDGADPSASIENYLQNQGVAANRYMHFSSSNYPSATALGNGGTRGEGNFYFAASNADALNDIFDTISEEISTDTTTLDGSATIVDNIPGNFTIPAEASGIKVYTAGCTGKKGETLTWAERASSPLQASSATVNGKTSVSVTGFNYSDEWCGLDENNQPHGSKLIIEFTIAHNNYGGTQPTNAGASIKDEENKDVITVDNPSVPVTIAKPSITGASATKVYDGTGIDVLANVAAEADKLVTGENKGKNAFVDIIVKVKDANNVEYTYTIHAGATTGSWDTENVEFKTPADVKIKSDGSVGKYSYDLSITYQDKSQTNPADKKTVTGKAEYTITKRPVTLTSETASKPYDGTPLTKPEVTVTDYNDGKNVFKNEVTDIKANGSVTEPSEGEVTNTISYTKGTEFKDSNYSITENVGKLSITPIAAPTTGLPEVTVQCTNGQANHQPSSGNELIAGTYSTSAVSKVNGKYTCTITLTDKNSYINSYNTETHTAHVADSQDDVTAVTMTYDEKSNTWSASHANFIINVKCDTPTVTVTYTWTGLTGVLFDEDQHKAPTPPTEATVTKGSTHDVDTMYYNGYSVTDVEGNVYKFSGWDKSGTFAVQENTTIRGTWTKSTGTFDLTNKIFKSFTKADKSNDIPTANRLTYNFGVKVTRQDNSSDVRYGSVTLRGNETAATAFNFAPNHTLTFDKAGIYTYSVEENSGYVSPNGAVKGNIINDARKYQLTIKVDGNLDVEAYSFIEMPAGDTPTGELTITFENKYDEDPDADVVTLDLGNYVTKTFESRHGKSATETFEAKVQIWLDDVPIITNAAAEEDSIVVYAEPEWPKEYTGTVKLSTGETKHFDFGGSITLDRNHRYRIRVTETAGSNTDVEYDKTVYETYVNFDYETKEVKWYKYNGNFSFTNTYTGIDDYYPIIIPTIINKDTGMLNKTDHFAYVIGYPDGTVHPNGQITRAEVATIFFRLLRDEVRDGAFTTSNTYSDVAYGKWYNNPISTMSALGIITGYPDGTFKPNKPITRAEFAAIAARFDETQSGKSATFSDVIGHWAAKEIGIAYYNDWIKGYPDGTFKPDQNITRAEAMTLINRVLERKPESPADLLTNMNKWTDNLDTSKWYYLDVQEATNSHGYTRKTFNYELWRQMLPDPDWSRYER